MYRAEYCTERSKKDGNNLRQVRSQHPIPSGHLEVPHLQFLSMAFVSSFTPRTTFFGASTALTHLSERPCVFLTPVASADSGKSSRNKRFVPGKSVPLKKEKLEPEIVFLETGPSRAELIIPTLSILTVIGIIPFLGSVARALWVKYKITSRRISVSSGFQGKDQTEIIYRDVSSIKYIRRLGGVADCVIELKDGAKLEIRSIPEFDKVFEYILSRLDDNAREASGPAC